MLQTGKDPDTIITAKGFDAPAFDSQKLEEIVDTILEQNQDAVQKYQSGKTSVIGFLLGQVMKETQGKVDPKEVSKMMTKKLA